jgi:hypothetical protein
MSGSAVSAKNLRIEPIDASSARAFVRKWHYSGKVDTRSALHLGVMWNGKLEGAMQFGASIDKAKAIRLVTGTHWNGFFELHRMAFSDRLPRNSESRAMSVAFRLIRKHAPHIEWLLSYADATQSGDGSIYRAAGFKLIGIKKNTSMWRMPDGQVCAKIVFEPGFQPNAGENSIKARYGKTGSETSTSFLKRIGAECLAGFQIRYFYPLHDDALSRLTVPVLPFSVIDEHQAGMYLGKPRQSGGGSVDSDTLITPDERRRRKSDPTARLTRRRTP